jgi:DNA-binding CsgD family transcriptional regulator
MKRFMRVVPREAEDVVPAAASGSWRNWLVTGGRREPIDRRRVRGAHKELKQLLAEGIHGGGDRTDNWKRFSDAMARQAVDEAIGSLPPRQKQLIKLAYFSDLSNREIAQGLGITASSVERGLRQAIARVSVYVEQGRAAGRRLIYGLALLLGGRWVTETAHQAAGPTTGELVRVGALAVAVATAGAILISQPAPQGQLPTADGGVTPAFSSAQPMAVMQIQAVQLPRVTTVAVESARSQAEKAAAAPVVALPVIAPPEVKLPKLAEPPVVKVEHHEIHIELPIEPIVHGLLGA